jgi:type II restriction enzyme
MVKLTKDKAEHLKRIDLIVKQLPQLTNGQFIWIEKVVNVFSNPSNFQLVDSNLFTKQIVNDFGDALRIHHCFSIEPFTKDKFEYLMETVFRLNKKNAKLAPKGNPGYDIEINGGKISLKTQADRDIKPNIIWISKYMELGKTNWGDKIEDLEALRDAFLKHLSKYKRVFVLRCLKKSPDFYYELVEIPLRILQKAAGGRLEMKNKSKQFPKPGYCYVTDNKNNQMFQLYFDGGGERKLQVKRLLKSKCKIHATWQFTVD